MSAAGIHSMDEETVTYRELCVRCHPALMFVWSSGSKIFLLEPQTLVEVVGTSAGSHPGHLDSEGLGWDLRICICCGIHSDTVLLAQRPHFESHCLWVLCVRNKKRGPGEGCFHQFLAQRTSSVLWLCWASFSSFPTSGPGHKPNPRDRHPVAC